MLNKGLNKGVGGKGSTVSLRSNGFCETEVMEGGFNTLVRRFNTSVKRFITSVGFYRAGKVDKGVNGECLNEVLTGCLFVCWGQELLCWYVVTLWTVGFQTFPFGVLQYSHKRLLEFYGIN